MEQRVKFWIETLEKEDPDAHSLLIDDLKSWAKLLRLIKQQL